MIINLDPIFSAEGAFQEIDYSLDLSGETVNGLHPFSSPVNIKGEIRNHTGIVRLDAKADSVLDVECDRCAAKVKYPACADVEHIIVRSLNDDDNDSFILAEGSQLELDDIIREDFLLQLPVKFLCSEDCKGLCPNCGKDLNEGPCSCKKEIDPRLAALAQFSDFE
jgi:uncharacterized protein